MGACVSVPDRCLGSSPHSSGDIKNRNKKIKIHKNKVSSHLSIRSLEKVDVIIDCDTGSPDHTSNVTAATSVEEVWFDTSIALESDGEEEFQSMKDDVLSLDECEGARSSVTKRSSKMLLQRPIAGSQVQFCPIDKKILDSWSQVEPSTFRVRAQNYLRDKKKEFATNHAAYYPFGVDVFLSPRKINHIARFVELPTSNISRDFPSYLVVNAQIPIYPPSLFQNESDGEGFNVVLYFKLSENYLKELPPHFRENIKKLIDGKEEKVKGFASDTIVPFRERLKILGRVMNVDELPINSAEKKIMHAYNGKPLLSRPQHEFFSGKNHFEIDLDMHRFSYISRKGFDTFLDRLKFCILDFGLTIQGNKTEELPEQMLCCIRLNGINYENYPQLGLTQESSGL